MNMKGLMITVIIMTMSMCMSVMKEIILQYALLIVLVWLVANVGMQVCKSVLKHFEKLNAFLVAWQND